MTISEKGIELSDAQLYKIAFTVAKANLTLIKDGDPNCALFQAKSGEYHLLISPSHDSSRLGKGFRLQNKLQEIEEFLLEFNDRNKEGCKLDLKNPNKVKLHTHYFICQTKGTHHFVYGYVNPEGDLTIKDSFPALKPNLHKHKIVPKIPRNSKGKYQYIHTGEQYNSTDCGHYALLEFKKNLGYKQPEASFMQTHARKIGFVLGALVMGTLLTVGMVFSGAIITLPVIGLAIGLSVANGFWGAYWAHKMDTRLDGERKENAAYLKQYANEKEKEYAGSNVHKELDKLPHIKKIENNLLKKEEAEEDLISGIQKEDENPTVDLISSFSM